MYFLVLRACAVTVCMSSYPINDTLLCFRLPRVGIALDGARSGEVNLHAHRH